VASYDYTCENEHLYTETRSMSEDQKVTVCPEGGCGKPLVRVWQSTPAVFNGGGFYSTDSRHHLLKSGQQVDY
jgi:predicted nucleic acid-binding Zn ribbon protein